MLLIIYEPLIKKVFNAIKNPIRIKILQEIVESGSKTLKEIQKTVKKGENYLSSSILQKYYLSPLIENKLIADEKVGYKATSLGRKIIEILFSNKEAFENLPRYQGKCYEEITLILLSLEPKTSDELANIIPYNVIPRTFRRIKKLICKKSTQSVKFANKISDGKKLSNAELQVYNVIQRKKQASVKEIIKEVNIHPRTVYKALSKLEAKGCVIKTREKHLYMLNEQGLMVVNLLKKIAENVIKYRFDEIYLKTLVLSYLCKSNGPVFESDLVDNVLDPYFKQKYGRPIRIDEVQKIKDEMRREGLLVGNPYTGYAVSREILEKLPKEIDLEKLIKIYIS